MSLWVTIFLPLRLIAEKRICGDGDPKGPRHPYRLQPAGLPSTLAGAMVGDRGMAIFSFRKDGNSKFFQKWDVPLYFLNDRKKRPPTLLDQMLPFMSFQAKLHRTHTSWGPLHPRSDTCCCLQQIPTHCIQGPLPRMRLWTLQVQLLQIWCGPSGGAVCMMSHLVFQK